MSIASEITRISGNVADAYTAANAKGATMPVSQNSGNLATTISTIPSGTTPTGTISITSNGTHDVTNYATANVNVPTTAPESYRVFRVSNGKLVNSITTPWIPIPSGVTDIDQFLFYSAYSSTPSSVLSGAIDLSMLTQVTGNSAFRQCFMNCDGITSVDASNITKLSGDSGFSGAFQNSGITSLDFRSLEYINNYGLQGACRNCLYLASINLDSFLGGYSQPIQALVWCDGGTRYNNNVLQSVSFPSLKYMNAYFFMGSCFKSCIALQTLYFPALTPSSFGTYTTQFNNMLQEVTGCAVHFPSNIQSTIGSWSDVTNGFGGTNTTVLFDLPSTAHLTGANSTEYERNPKYDTATALAWRVKDTGTLSNLVIDWTPYYTSGTTDPAVSDAIYSDAACTQSVTTITAIS